MVKLEIEAKEQCDTVVIDKPDALIHTKLPEKGKFDYAFEMKNGRNYMHACTRDLPTIRQIK